MQDRQTASGENGPDTLCWVLKRTRSGSKLPAANSRSGSTEGHGASGDLFAMRGAFGRVRVFFEIGCEETWQEKKQIVRKTSN